MAESTEVAIIGGGAAGCAAAWYLSRAGISSTIIEREGVASQASGYAAGGLNPLTGTGIPGPLADFAWESFRLHLDLYPELKTLTEIDYQLRQTSEIMLTFDQSSVSGLEDIAERFTHTDGFSASITSESQVAGTRPENQRGLRRMRVQARQLLPGQPGLHPRPRTPPPWLRSRPSPRQRSRPRSQPRPGVPRPPRRRRNRMRAGPAGHGALVPDGRELAEHLHPRRPPQGRDSPHEVAWRPPGARCLRRWGQHLRQARRSSLVRNHRGLAGLRPPAAGQTQRSGYWPESSASSQP